MILVVVVAVIWCPISAKTFSSLNPTSIYTLPIYYVQSQTSNLHIHQDHHDYNCTRESPCHTIQQALQLIITQFNSSVIDKRSGKIILLGDSFGVDQCNIQIPGNCKDERFVHCAAFDEIVLDTELDRGVSLDCDNQRLFKELEVRNLTIHNLNLSRIYIGLNRAPAVDRLILQSVSMYNIQVKDTSEMPINLDKRVVIVESSIVERCTIDLIGKSEIQILQSRVHGTTMHTLQSAISIWNSNLTHFEFLLQTTSDDLENDMLDIRNSFLCNTTLRLDRFKYISFSYATFSDNTFLQVSNSDSISCGNVNAIGGHFYWLFRENNLVTVASSEFSFLNLFDESWSNKLIDIDSCKQLFIFGCSFENNRGIILGIEFTNILDLQDLSFENNYGNCIYADMSQRRGVSQMTLESVLFRKNKCSTDMNGCALSVQANEIFIRNIRCIEHSGASNGGSLYIQAKNTLQIFSSLFLDNLASQLGGAIYIGNSATATFTIENTTCVNNSAQYAGGCIYYESPQQKEASILKDNVFYNNEGKSYGNDIGFPLYNMKYELKMFYNSNNVQTFQNSTEITIYPGQFISHMELTLWNNGTDRILFLETGTNLIFRLNETQDHQAVLHFENNRTNSLRLDRIAVFMYSAHDVPITLHSALSIYNEKNWAIEVVLHVDDCPSGLQMDLQQIPANSYGCNNSPPIPYNVIIPVVSIVSILSFSILVLLLYVTFKVLGSIIAKLNRLKRKEEAEKKMESKLIDKRIVLMDEEYSVFNQTTGQGIDESTSLLHPKREKSVVPGTTSINHSTAQNSRKNNLHHTWIISIDEIEILRRISEGANGTVYLASWNGTRVALKTLKNLKFTDENDEAEKDEEFEREASLLASIRHPNVVQFFGVIMAGTKKYMVVEYLDNGSLDQLIYRSKNGIEKLDIYRKIDILLGVSKGMQYLHSLKPHGIIHRDLKPGNILISKSYTSKICDFGLSKTSKNQSTSNSAATTNVGTLFYMSNEMISGDSKYNHKTDIYSFAIVMWELFFEENPYLNFGSKKLYGNMVDTNAMHTDVYGFNILPKIVNGLRPIIPFHTKTELRKWIEEFHFYQENSDLEKLSDICEKYISIMKSCWSHDSSARPEFSEVTSRLTELLSF